MTFDNIESCFYFVWTIFRDLVIVINYCNELFVMQKKDWNYEMTMDRHQFGLTNSKRHNIRYQSMNRNSLYCSYVFLRMEDSILCSEQENYLLWTPFQNQTKTGWTGIIARTSFAPAIVRRSLWRGRAHWESESAHIKADFINTSAYSMYTFKLRTR